MTSRPRKPWRVTLTGTDVRVTSEHTSEKAAYAFLATALREHGNRTARVDHWERGVWWWFETVAASDLPAES